jgi:hypothetical protein
MNDKRDHLNILAHRSTTLSSAQPVAGCPGGTLSASAA